MGDQVHFFRNLGFWFYKISNIACNGPCPVAIHIFVCLSRAMVSGGEHGMVPVSWQKNVSTRSRDPLDTYPYQWPNHHRQVTYFNDPTHHSPKPLNQWFCLPDDLEPYQDGCRSKLFSVMSFSFISECWFIYSVVYLLRIIIINNIYYKDI